MRFLVVEDHPFQRGVLVHLLSSIDAHAILQAANGSEALALLEGDTSTRPDVIICDLDMPEMDGVELLTTIAERRLAGGVIIVSARESGILRSVETMARAMGFAVLGNFRKPVSAQQLRDALAKYAPNRQVSPPARERKFTPAQLRRAIEERQFRAAFQPKVRLVTRAFEGVEALARWPLPEGGAVPPSDFVPAVVSEGLITTLTEHMLEEACRALNAWEKDGLRLSVALNVSMVTLSDLAVVNRFADFARQRGIDTHRITFEVTETEVMTDVVRILNVLSRLRLKGFHLAVDDFGTGHSSLQQLNTIPFTELKLDRAFVHGCGQPGRQQHIVKSSIELAQHLGIRTVAEGVEAQADWDFLAANGCDEAQGFLITRALPPEEIPGWADAWRRRGSAALR